MNRPRCPFACVISWILFAFVVAASGAERFDDISIAPQSLVAGETQHGYREYRVLLENRSAKDTHVVTLVYPDRPYNYGNTISRISRTVSVGPSVQAVVPIWQPALPAGGVGSMQVFIDDELAGTVVMPGAAHMGRGHSRYSGSAPPASILISRGLNYDEADRTFKPGGVSIDFSAQLATGSPDASGRRGVPALWAPDNSLPGPHWIELIYDTTLTADRVRLYGPLRLSTPGKITIKGVSGTNLAEITIPVSTAVTSGPHRPEVSREFSFGVTPEPVKSVRIEFGSSPAFSGLDAVEVAGPVGSTWATSATASSENRTPFPTAAVVTPGMEARELLRAELPVSEWGEHWLSYTPFDAIALSAADLRTAPVSVQSALWRYAECGGNLFVFGRAELPGTWQASANTLEGGRCLIAGFGQCFVLDGKLSDLQPAAVKTLMNAATASARFWQSLPDQASANGIFQVVDNVRIPVRGTVFIMLAFVILIGPINLIVLSRMNRRTWLLWTVPAISLLTCLVVFVYSLLREGITPDVRIDGLTLLDQSNHRATTLGCAAFYCPLTPSQGLFFAPETEATPLLEVFHGMYRRGRPEGTPRQVDWTQSQHLTRGWVTARVPAHFHLRKSINNARERIQLENTDGKPAVVNGLGAGIRSLWLADSTGRIYVASRIPEGVKAALTACSEYPQVNARRGVGSLIERSPLTPGADLTNAPAFLLPGTYIAELESNPFLENGLGPKARSGRTRSGGVVYGLLEPSAAR